MGIVTFPSGPQFVNWLLTQVNAAYSMYDTGTATWKYMNDFQDRHDIATSLKGMDFIFNVATAIYSQTAQFEANPVLVVAIRNADRVGVILRRRQMRQHQN